MHAAMVELRLSVSSKGEACELNTEEVLTPAQTYQKLLRNGRRRSQVLGDGRAHCWGDDGAVSPGIPVCMPGERLGGQDSP